MEDKAIGIKVEEVIGRIRALQASREEDKKIAEAIMSVEERQMLGRSMRATAGKPAVRTITMDDVKEAAERFGIMYDRITCTKPSLDFQPLEQVFLEKPEPREPLEWKVTEDFQVFGVSMVSDPEPGCEIQVTPEDAFDYAMKLVEK